MKFISNSISRFLCIYVSDPVALVLCFYHVSLCDSHGMLSILGFEFSLKEQCCFCRHCNF